MAPKVANRVECEKGRIGAAAINTDPTFRWNSRMSGMGRPPQPREKGPQTSGLAASPWAGMWVQRQLGIARESREQ